MKQSPPKILVSLLILFCVNVFAQVGIGTATPDQSAMLDVAGNNKGTLLSRVSLSGNADIATIPNPAVGLMVYNTTAVAVGTDDELPVGYHYWNGTKWVNIAETSNSNGSNAKIKTYAYVGPYSGQSTNGINVGDFSFRILLSPNIVSGTTSENVSPQIRNNTVSNIDLTGFAAMNYGNGSGTINYTSGTVINTAANLANPNTRTLPANSWAWWGESGFIQAGGGSTSEKRQYTLTVDDVNYNKFWRVEFMFINPGGTVATLPTAKCVIYVEEVIGMTVN
ncbi:MULTISPECIES: hypothetical protein [Flavobacterium]|uniref:hypothetical protein n=1 Tax=Flavobacterium TaxID=237 RepID=UPI00086ADDC5|nr:MULTISPECIES: hypothetical protein [Flavobacterium]MBN9285175.1 hypothetical protein [Flavobacterium sp.]ODS78207.1 MAG: hypothetical protein ABS44_21950 [Chryseobacterium sp. SCN 40-13]OJV72105.1 MAG: hypothetical protein BGO42_01710 [Flavobacterium sp. 40-81]